MDGSYKYKTFRKQHGKKSSGFGLGKSTQTCQKQSIKEKN